MRGNIGSGCHSGAFGVPSSPLAAAVGTCRRWRLASTGRRTQNPRFLTQCGHAQCRHQVTLIPYRRCHRIGLATPPEAGARGATASPSAASSAAGLQTLAPGTSASHPPPPPSSASSAAAAVPLPPPAPLAPPAPLGSPVSPAGVEPAAVAAAVVQSSVHPSASAAAVAPGATEPCAGCLGGALPGCLYPLPVASAPGASEGSRGAGDNANPWSPFESRQLYVEASGALFNEAALEVGGVAIPVGAWEDLARRWPEYFPDYQRRSALVIADPAPGSVSAQVPPPAAPRQQRTQPYPALPTRGAVVAARRVRACEAEATCLEDLARLRRAEAGLYEQLTRVLNVCRRCWLERCDCQEAAVAAERRKAREERAARS